MMNYLNEDSNIGFKQDQQKKKRQNILLLIVCLLLIVVAFVIGYFARSSDDCENGEKKTEKYKSDEREKIYDSMADMIVAENIEENLKYFAARPHAAGTPQNNKLLDEIYSRFESYNFVSTRHVYDTLLTYPDPNQHNYVYILDDMGNKIFKSLGIEKFLEPKENDPTAFGPFNGYGPSGQVEGELIYVNYGRVEDFEELETKYNVNISGKIAIVRYGKIFRGNKVSNAAQKGAIGCIIYSDPFDVAPEGEKFIKGRWLPDDGVQRGSVITLSEYGDITSVGYPGKPWYYHSSIADVKKYLPQIPVQPVSAYDAYNLMSYMGGVEVADSWSGNLNITYKTGPYTNKSRKVRMEVFNKQEMKTITNVCGTIKGVIEPDRYVLFGNHVDAWVFGGVDPSSGTSVMMEVARVLSEQLKQDWRPRRTIKFCGWDGEEYNLIGSSEYVEEFYSQLRDRAVAYINIDSAASGNESISCNASPLLHELMFKVHRKVQHPYAGKSVFDEAKLISPDMNYPNDHAIGSLGSGSDFTHFYQYVGVTSLDYSFQQLKTNKRLKIGGYPVYHSLHDTFYWIKHFVDRDFKIHRAVAQIGIYYLLYIADSDVIPFDVKRYEERLQREVKILSKTLQQDRYKDKQLNIDTLRSAIDNFTSAYDEFTEQKKKVNIENPLELRILNDRLSQLEKGFLYVNGLPGRRSTKHYIMAPSKHNAYGSSSFPAISDVLFEAETNGDWNSVKREISITSYIIQSVANNLKSLI